MNGSIPQPRPQLAPRSVRRAFAIGDRLLYVEQAFASLQLADLTVRVPSGWGSSGGHDDSGEFARTVRFDGANLFPETREQFVDAVRLVRRPSVT